MLILFDKQFVMRDLFFAGLSIAGNSCRGEQIMPMKPLFKDQAN